MVWAAILGAAALLLFIGERFLGARAQGAGGPDSRPVLEQADVQAAIDTLLRRHGIPESSVRTWRVLTPDRHPLRVEQRIGVPRDFLSLVFNNELNLRLRVHGAHIVATERSRESTVTMHVVRKGRTIRSIMFVASSDG